MLPTINFRQIRLHEGAQDRAFEELCCQLAHLESHPGGEFIRKGEGGDAGVECFWRLSNGEEYGWQAKYVFKLGASEAAQLNKSFQEAFAKHAALSRYIVCLPFNLSDPRATRQGKRLKSQLDRWDELIRKWTMQASLAGRSIQVTLWNASRVAGLLEDERPQYAGKVLYWFGAPSLSSDLLRKRADVAIANLGPRYTPALHVDLPIAQLLDGLCWHESFRERVREMRRTLHQGANRCQREAEDKESIRESLIKAVSSSRNLADALEVLADVAPEPEVIESLRPLAANAAQSVEELDLKLAELQRRIDRGDKGLVDLCGGRDGRTLNNAHYCVLQLGSFVEDAEEFLASHQVSASATRALLIRGEAGIGKSHLIADVVRDRIAAGQPTVFVLGQHVQQGDAWNAARKALDLPEQPTAYILGALDAAAEASRSRALIAVDAINEGGGASVWRDQLAGFLREARTLPRVAVVLTCRTAFERRCAPVDIQEGDLIRITHRGFAGHVTKALQAYFDRQGLARPSTPFLSPEFHSPLFLKTVTKALKLAKLNTLPRGLHGVKQIMEFYGQCLDAAVSREMGVSDRRKLGIRALRTIATFTAESNGDSVLRTPLIEKLDCIADKRGRELWICLS